MAFSLFLHVLCIVGLVQSAVTVYDLQGPVRGTSTASTGQAPSPTDLPSVVLVPPPPPVPPPQLAFNIELYQSSLDVPGGVSIAQDGSFFGFSIEQSVVANIIGNNSTFIHVPFLNLLGALKARAGKVRVRIGGNSQERATMVDSLPNGSMMAKTDVESSGTPALSFTPELLYLMANISSLVNAQWYLGIPFNDTKSPRLGIAEHGQRVLGPNLLGLQVGNEPDLYVSNKRRSIGYTPTNYTDEFGDMVRAMKAAQIPATNLIGPSISSVAGSWTPEKVWDTGFLSKYAKNLGAISFEHYSGSACTTDPLALAGTVTDPQQIFANYLTHTAVQSLVLPYVNSSLLARQVNKELLMMETNTASCGGYPGISDSFGAALWALDYAFALASANFAAALFHTGGQNVYYNAFTPPPGKKSSFRQWTVGAVFYPSLVVSEAFGLYKTAQIVDIGANSQNQYTPGYAIYNEGQMNKLALFNYISDPSGAHDYTAAVSIGGPLTGKDQATPVSVRVKYLAAASVSEKYNITWASQTYGGRWQSDGRLKGGEVTVEVQCPNHTCQIKVPAPGFALVFFNGIHDTPTTTFSTTVGLRRTVPVLDPAALETSNGHSGPDRGSTSRRSSQNSSGICARGPSELGTWFLLGLGVVWLGI